MDFQTLYLRLESYIFTTPALYFKAFPKLETKVLPPEVTITGWNLYTAYSGK